jgi:hypothetical protein
MKINETTNQFAVIVATLINNKANARDILKSLKNVTITPNIEGVSSDLKVAVSCLTWNDKKKAMQALTVAYEELSLLGLIPNQSKANDAETTKEKATKKSKKAKAKKSDLTDDQIVELEQIANDVKEQFAIIDSAVLKVGELLARAKDILSGQAAWLRWAKKECNVGKSHAYRLIKVYEAFKDLPEAQDLSGRVLTALLTANAKVVEQVLDIKDNGETVTEKDVKDLKKQDAKEQKANADKGTDTTDTPEESEHKESDVDEKIKGELDNDTKELTEHNPLLDSTETDKSFMVDTDDTNEGSDVKVLLAKIQELQKELSDAREEMVKLSEPAKYNLPMLHQFNSSHAHVVLGLSVKDSKIKNKVRNAYREYAAIWTKEQNEPAFTFLTTAKETLLNA